MQSPSCNSYDPLPSYVQFVADILNGMSFLFQIGFHTEPLVDDWKNSMIHEWQRGRSIFDVVLDFRVCFHIPIPLRSDLLPSPPGPRLNIKTVFPRYGDSHVKDKTVARPYYLQHGDPYTGKTTSLYWDSTQALIDWSVVGMYTKVIRLWMYTHLPVYLSVDRNHYYLNKHWIPPDSYRLQLPGSSLYDVGFIGPISAQQCLPNNRCYLRSIPSWPSSSVSFFMWYFLLRVAEYNL